MHVHILNKMWDVKWDDCSTHCHTGAPMIPCNYVKGMKSDMGSQVDMCACTDACTHLKQGVGREMR